MKFSLDNYVGHITSHAKIRLDLVIDRFKSVSECISSL